MVPLGSVFHGEFPSYGAVPFAIGREAGRTREVVFRRGPQREESSTNGPPAAGFAPRQRRRHGSRRGRKSPGSVKNGTQRAPRCRAAAERADPAGNEENVKTRAAGQGAQRRRATRRARSARPHPPAPRGLEAMDLGAQPAERKGTALGVLAERYPLRVRLCGAARRGSREDEGRTRGAPVRAAQRPGSRVGACPGARTRPHPPASRGLERAALDVESAERTGTNVGVLAVANLYAPGCVRRRGRGGRTEDGRAASPQHATHRVTRRRVSRCEGATARKNEARNKRAGHLRGRGGRWPLAGG